MVEAEVERAGKTTIARRFFLSSLPLDAPLLARAVRAHWGIENRLHWVLDAVFHGDLMLLRTENGPRNMATIKHMAMNLIRNAPRKQSLKVRRKAAAWDQGHRVWDFGASKREHTWNDEALLVAFYSEFHQIGSRTRPDSFKRDSPEPGTTTTSKP